MESRVDVLCNPNFRVVLNLDTTRQATLGRCIVVIVVVVVVVDVVVFVAVVVGVVDVVVVVVCLLGDAFLFVYFIHSTIVVMVNTSALSYRSFSIY